MQTFPVVTARRACALTGITYRRLDYWTTGGVLAPIGRVSRYGDGDGRNPGSGVEREFTLDHLHALRVLARVCDLFDSEEGGRRGLTLDRLTRIVEALADARWPTSGYLLVGEFARYVPDVYDLVVTIEVEDLPWLVVPLRPSDRFA